MKTPHTHLISLYNVENSSEDGWILKAITKRAPTERWKDNFVDKLYDGKYNQILWSLEKLGINPMDMLNDANLQESIIKVLREEFNNLLNRLKPYLIEGKYLYHYTPTYNLDDIKEEGLIPRKTPNSFYKDGIEGIFLTNKSSLYSANLPQDLMNLMDEYYENGEEEEKPIVRLTVDVTQLNPNKITWDDDYIMNQYKWNKSNTDEDKIIESIDIWGTISYKGLIQPELIINEDFDYLS
jgi:hypothetical protein